MKYSRYFLLIAFTILSSHFLFGQDKYSTSNPVIRMSTDVGDIEIELYEKQAPITVGNFLEYISKEMFTGAHFYRAVTMDNQPDNDIRIEVIQGGLGWTDTVARLDPIRMETTDETGILHLNGTLSMARDAPDSADTEFFICINDQPDLDYGGRRNPDGQGFAAFGRVVKGMEVVKEIHLLPNESQMLIEPVMIGKIERVQ